jgi:hypothetical protein
MSVLLLTEIRLDLQSLSLVEQSIYESQLRDLDLADDHNEDEDNTDPFERSQPVCILASQFLQISEAHIVLYILRVSRLMRQFFAP